MLDPALAALACSSFCQWSTHTKYTHLLLKQTDTTVQKAVTHALEQKIGAAIWLQHSCLTANHSLPELLPLLYTHNGAIGLQDPDSTVREAAGDALGHIAEGLQQQHSPLTAGDPTCNIVLRAILDAVQAQKKEAQQAAAYALSKVYPSSLAL